LVIIDKKHFIENIFALCYSYKKPWQSREVFYSSAVLI